MSSTKTINIFLAEDHLIARMGLKMLLEQTSHFNVIGEAEDGEAAVEKILECKPDVVMMDLGLPKIDGIEATNQVKKALPATKVLIFTTAEDDSSIFAALKAGADGYCLKTISGEMLAIAIQSVLNGAAWLDPGIAHKVLRAQSNSQAANQSAPALSETKLELLLLVEQGKSFEEIASELKVNDTLVKGLLNELLKQLNGSVADSSEKVAGKAENAGPVTIRPGDIIGQHYKVEMLLGSGGMGAVYRASHTVIDRIVAIKTLHEHLASEPSTLERFKIEAQSNARAVHQNLVTIYDFGLFHSKIPYLVMEFLDGQSFENLLEREGHVSVEAGKKIFSQVLDALEAVHAKGIVHRDLKPANIMLLRREDNPCLVKVVDFGIAKILDANNSKLTQTGECLGSPLYMSPEQCWGSGKYTIDHRSDLYSLGCMFYEAFTGCPIFEASSVLEVVMKHIKEEPSVEPLKKAGLSPKLIELILKLTKKNPQDRPSSAAEVRELLLLS